MTSTKKHNFSQRLVQALIVFYQKTLSPDHGVFRQRYPYGFCRFYPSCSQYTYDAVALHGAWRGLSLGVGRILRCNPWAASRVDRVPKSFKSL